MNEPSILIIEDDKAVKDLIVTTLETHDYHYTWTDKGEQGILPAASQQPDIILLDLGLLDMDEVGVILRVRSWTNTLVIVISARGEDSGRIAALDVGADGYPTKPFSADELLARLRPTQRRLRYMQSPEEVQSPLFTNGELIIDYAVGCVCLGGEEPHLAPYEYKLLCLLIHSVRKVLIRSYITREMWDAVWGGNVVSPRVFVTSLRKKIGKNPSQPQYIQTHVGVGYRMMER